MKSLLALALILWVGLQVTGSPGMSLVGSDGLHAAGAALGGGLAVLLAGLAVLTALFIVGALFFGALALSFPLLFLVLVVGVFLVPALLPVLLLFLILGLLLKVFAAALCW